MVEDKLEEEYLGWQLAIREKHDPKYYENLLKFSPIIVSDLDKYKQHFIARKLRISGPKLSTIKPLLEAHVAIIKKG